MGSIGAGALVVGAILFGLGLGFFPSSSLILLGLIIGAAGGAVMYFGKGR